MGNYSKLIEEIRSKIKTNGAEEITGDILQQILVDVVDTMGEYGTISVANEDTDPSNVEQNVVYIASGGKEYPNFGIEYLSPGIWLLVPENETWKAISLGKPLMVNTTWAELKALRDRGDLVAGTQYRITDYETTTTQEGTSSANHPFDVIVMANSTNVLSEFAKAINRDGDTYFSEAGANLSAWRLWYCLDNDTTKFAWADEANGKGVIYRMIDEWNNDCPYDFKNIIFLQETLPNGVEIVGFIPDQYYYTFSWVAENGEIQDCSLVGQSLKNDEGGFTGCYENIIEACDLYHFGSFSSFGYALNNIVFISTWELESGLFYGIYGNMLGPNCHNITGGNYCFNNHFGTGCSIVFIGDDSFDNTLGDYNSNILLPASCGRNEFGSTCTSIKLYLGSYGNKFGFECSNINVLTTEFQYNTLESGVHEINLDQDSPGFVKNYTILSGNYGSKSVDLIPDLNHKTIVSLNDKGNITFTRFPEEPDFFQAPRIEVQRLSPASVNPNRIKYEGKNPHIVIHHPYYDLHKDECFFALMKWTPKMRRRANYTGTGDEPIRYVSKKQWNFFKGLQVVDKGGNPIKIQREIYRNDLIGAFIGRPFARVHSYGFLPDDVGLEEAQTTFITSTSPTQSAYGPQVSALLIDKPGSNHTEDIILQNGAIIDFRVGRSYARSVKVGIALVRQNPAFSPRGPEDKRDWDGMNYRWIVSDVAPMKITATSGLEWPNDENCMLFGLTIL